MRTSTLMAAGFSLALFAARADVVTNAETFVVSVPTTLSGATNIFTHTTLPAQIDADLTLDNFTYLRFMGANTTGIGGSHPDTNPTLKIGTTREDVRLTVKGRSLFAATYRNSKSPAYWANLGIDPVDSAAAPSKIRIHLGTPGGAPGSTGSVKLDIQTQPQGFGGNVFGAFWAEWLYINSSVKPSDSGYIDFLDLASGVVADIAFIDNLSETPARILFRGGQLFSNNVNTHGAPIAVSTGHELILEGVNGNFVEYCKQYRTCNFTARRGGTVRFRGNEVRLRTRGSDITPKNNQYLPWNLSAEDNVVWEHSGRLYLMESCFLVLQGDDLLPHEPRHAEVRFNYNNAGWKEKSPNYLNYCTLDIGATTQHVNGMISDEQDDRRLGVVTNVAYAAGTSQDRGLLIFGDHDLSCTLNVHCAPGVDVKKIGTGALFARNASGESLEVTEGTVVFSDVCAFDRLTITGTALAAGEVSVNAEAVFGAGVDLSQCSLVLQAGALISAEGAITLNSLKVNGAYLPAGEYTQAPWLAPGSGAVRVIFNPTTNPAAVAWTGAGTDDSVATAENWADASKVDFTSPVTIPEFAASGSTALFTAPVSSLAGLTFNAPGAFTLFGSDAANELALYGALTLGGEGSRTYTVDMPLKLCGSAKTLTVPNSDVTLHLRDLSGVCDFNIVGEKLGSGANDYATNGVIILENARTFGSIDHTKGGGTVILRGEIGAVGDTGTYALNYGQFRYPTSDKSEEARNAMIAQGWCELGKTRVENVVFRKKFSMAGGGQTTGSTNTERFLVYGGETNIFEELVTQVPSCTVNAEGGTVTIFKKGLTNTGGSSSLQGKGYGDNRASAANPAVYVFDGPFITESTVRNMQFSGNSVKAVFNCRGNRANLYLSLHDNSRIEFVPDDAFTDTVFCFRGNSVVDLGGTHQQVRFLMSQGANASAPNYGTFTSAEPATLEITQGAPYREESEYGVGPNADFFHKGISTNSTQQFTGPISLVKTGAGYFIMNRNGPIESTGALRVSGGTVEFMPRASWPNAASVTVDGSGALILGAGETFGRKGELHLAGSGTLALPVGAVMRVNALYLDGSAAPAKAGLYGAVGDAGAAYTTPHILSGRVRVANLGTRIILR